MAPLSLHPDQVDRFRRDLEAVAGALPDRLGVAVSGGPDSLALLLLAHFALPGRVEAATADHGLRPESAGEARTVADLCGCLGIPHATLAVTVPDSPAGLQAAAREARYEALEAWAAPRALPSIATAHHADDQAETLLMRLQRGAGLSGLAGIRPARPLGAIRLLRPLLGWTKAELVALAAAAGLTPADDPSNRDPRFDRARVRAFLAASPELDPAAIARSAAALGEAEQALAWAADRLWQERAATEAGTLTLDPRDLPPELQRRLLARALAGFTLAPPPRGDALTRLLAALARGETATLAGVKCTGGPAWTFAPAPPRRS